jgi:hypothetical protein
MRYSIAFLGLIAFASSAPNCEKGLQPLLKPLAKEPAAVKFCATKYPPSGSATTATTEIKSSNPYAFPFHALQKLTDDE